jgi:hypothetical protein
MTLCLKQAEPIWVPAMQTAHPVKIKMTSLQSIAGRDKIRIKPTPTGTNIKNFIGWGAGFSVNLINRKPDIH